MILALILLIYILMLALPQQRPFVALGGNLTPIGASANIAAIGILRKNGETVRTKDFLRISPSRWPPCRRATAACGWCGGKHPFVSKNNVGIVNYNKLLQKSFYVLTLCKPLAFSKFRATITAAIRSVPLPQTGPFGPYKQHEKRKVYRYG